MSNTRKRKGERPDGYIQVTLTIGKDGSGKAIRKSFFGRTRAEAVRKREEYKTEYGLGLDMANREITLDAWLEKWSATYKVSSDYDPYVNRLRATLGPNQVRSIRPLHLRQTLHDAYEGKSTSSATKYRMIIKQVFSQAKINRIIMTDPSENLKLPKTVSGSHRALERWETDLIMDNWRVHHAGRWAMVMLLCGLRRGEMVALDWDAVDLENKTVTVSQTADLKKGKPRIKSGAKSESGVRTLPLCAPLISMLEETPIEKRNGPVCRKADGKRVTSSGIDRGWDTFCKAMTRIANGEKPIQTGRRTDREKQDPEVKPKEPAVVFDCLPHDLRHTYATALYDAGVDIKSAQYYLGHANVRMTIELYTHLTEEKENRARSSLTDYLDNWLNPPSLDNTENT